jgi:hypothetical protein
MSTAVGLDMVVVNIKKVINRKPKSTIGVRSTRGAPFPPLISIAAIISFLKGKESAFCSPG